MTTEFGKLLMLLGIVLVALGVMLTFNPLGLGKLPGDFLVKRGNFTFYYPLATSIVVSILLTVLFWLFGGRKP